MAHFKNVPFVSVAGQGHVVSKIRALKIKWYIARRCKQPYFLSNRRMYMHAELEHSLSSRDM